MLSGSVPHAGHPNSQFRYHEVTCVCKFDCCFVSNSIWQLHWQSPEKSLPVKLLLHHCVACCALGVSFMIFLCYKERDFCELFGCGTLVCLALWSVHVTIYQILVGRRIEHLLWLLMFMKTNGKKNELVSLAG